jgi:hypothetical protein
MNGYVRITINNSEVGLKFGHLAQKLFWDVAEKRWEFYAGDNTTPFSQYGWAKYFHAAYLNNCLLKEADPTLTYEDFAEWMETIGTDESVREQFKKAVNVWGEAQTTQEILKNLQAVASTGEEKPRKGKKKAPTG